MRMSRAVVVAVLAVVIVGGVGLMLWPAEPLPPYPRPRPDILIWDGSLPKPEGMR
jgi:hypothetical protein